jgi:uncharacterized membrane protein (DUF485 family)
MPLLAVFLGNMFGGLVAYLSAFLTRKAAFGVAISLVFTVLTTAFIVVFRATLASLNVGLIGAPAYMIQGIGLAVTDGVLTCTTTYITTWAACTAYTWQRDLLFLAANA